MSAFLIRPATPADRAGIRRVEELAFAQKLEADLVERLVSDGDAVLELVAESEGQVVGHILFSRLTVEGGGIPFAAVALAPLCVEPGRQKQGIGAALVEAAHQHLSSSGEVLSIVLGEPAYYGRFGYAHDRAAGFASDYQCYALQALYWGDAPATGRLVYARAFAEL